MAGGPLLPIGINYDTDGLNYPGPYVGAGNARLIPVHTKVQASLSGDTLLYLIFRLPATLPTGTLKLAILLIANATTGNAKVNPAWASVAVTENPDTITLNAEGVSTIAPSAADTWVETKVTLDADTAVGGEFIMMAVTFTTASWTLAVISGWTFYLLWE
ncbi:MAG: hypothetical protein WC822_06760 [Candidatus Paceibacterota bacterium]|jgi:hypothetical protein